MAPQSPSRPERRSLSSGTALGLALLLLVPGPAAAQFMHPPFPGTKPTKLASGPGLTWNGEAWQAQPGVEITWDISVVNDAIAPAVNVTLSDDVPDPADGAPVDAFDVATDVLERPPTGILRYDGDYLFLEEVRLPIGESFHLRFVTRVNTGLPAGTMVCNEALVVYLEEESGTDPPTLPRRWGNWTRDPSGEERESCVVIGNGSSLAESFKAVSDAGGDGFASPGELLTWTITVRNTGDAAASSIVATDLVPAPLEVQAVGQGGILIGNDLEWNETTTPSLASLAAGGEVELSFTALYQGCPAPGAMACNQASFRSAERPTPVVSDDPATPGLAEPTCIGLARGLLADSPLSLSEVSGDGLFAPGERVTWTLEVTNSGSGPATDVEVELVLPPELVSIVPGNGGLLSGSRVSWSPAEEPGLASIAPGASLPLSVDARIDVAAAGSAPCAQAVLRAGAGCADELSHDPAVAGAGEPTCFEVEEAPQLQLNLNVSDPDGDGRLELGEVLELELRLLHLSGAPASEVAVALDIAPALALGLLEADEGGSIGVDSWTWDSGSTPELLSVGPGDVVVLHGRGTLQCEADFGLPLCVDGAATASNVLGAVPATAPDCVDLDVPSLALSLSALDASGDGQVEADELVTLELLVENTGRAAARDLVVTLPLVPADLDVVPMDGGALVGSAIEWDAAGNPALLRLDPAASLVLRCQLRVDPDAFGDRTCHQASAVELFGCEPALSDDATLPGPEQPTCWDVIGDGLPPGEVPDGDVSSGGPVPVRFRCEGENLRLEFDAAPRALTHAVYRGELASFLSRPWTNPANWVDDPENAEPSCDLPALTWLDEGECVVGRPDWYYLVAGRNAYGEGPLGERQDSGGDSPRDPVGLPCP